MQSKLQQAIVTMNAATVPILWWRQLSAQRADIQCVLCRYPVFSLQCAEIQATAQMFGHFPMKDEKELRPQLNYQTKKEPKTMF